jgi:CyaY protein
MPLHWSTNSQEIGELRSRHGRACLEFAGLDSFAHFKEASMSTPEPTDGLSDAQYDAAIQATLSRIEATVDRWLEGDVVDIDSARTGGMLTLTMPNRSQLIINAQPPLQELWLAARRGGFHFRMGPGGQWLDTKSGEEFFALLSSCASEQGKAGLSF